MYFSNFSPDAKVWIYQSDKPMNESLRAKLNNLVASFIDEWSAHGTKLQAEGKVIDEYRLVLCTDGNVEASGCSIDASVRFIKKIGDTYSLNFFNRLLVLVDKKGSKELLHFSALKDNTDLKIFQPSPKNLGELRENETVLVSTYLN